MKKHFLILSLLFAVGSLRLQAQEEATETTMPESSMYSTPAFSVNGNFQVGIPLDAFRDNLDQVGFGAGFLFLANIAHSPVSLGADLSIMVYESQSSEYRVRVGGFTKDYELTTSSNIFLGHAVMRIQPVRQGFIAPYIDGMVGFKNLFTNSTLPDQDSNESVDSDVDQSDWALSYGGAIGLQIHFNKNHNLSLDLRCAYLPGNNATYLVRAPDPIGGFNYDDPLDAFEKKNSPTTLLLPQIGLTFKFWNTKTQEER